jgi:hypothetical protein
MAPAMFHLIARSDVFLATVPYGLLTGDLLDVAYFLLFTLDEPIAAVSRSLHARGGGGCGCRRATPD